MNFIEKMLDFENTTFEPFQINKIMSRSNGNIKISNKLNKYVFTLRKDDWIRLANICFSTKIPLYKIEKINMKEKNWFYKKIYHFFNIPKRIFLEYEKILSKDNILKICNMMGFSDKEIKNLGFKIEKEKMEIPKSNSNSLLNFIR